MGQVSIWHEEERAHVTKRWVERIRAFRLKLARPCSQQLDWQQFIEQALIEMCSQKASLIRCVHLSTSVFADITCWYRKIEEYRGYVLYSTKGGNTVLFDCFQVQYVVIGAGAARELVVCANPVTAKRFVDALFRIYTDSNN